jgi:hypothetical protein
MSSDLNRVKAAKIIVDLNASSRTVVALAFPGVLKYLRISTRDLEKVSGFSRTALRDYVLGSSTMSPESFLQVCDAIDRILEERESKARFGRKLAEVVRSAASILGACRFVITKEDPSSDQLHLKIVSAKEDFPSDPTRTVS